MSTSSSIGGLNIELVLYAYLEKLKWEICSVEVENAQLSGQVEHPMKGYFEDLNSQIKKKKAMLKSLEDLKYTLKRCEGVTVLKQHANKVAHLNNRLIRIKVGSFSYVSEGLLLGQLHGNRFTITLRGIYVFLHLCTEVVADSADTVKAIAYALGKHGFISYFAYTQTNQHRYAINDCHKTIAIDPNYSNAYSRLGFTYYAQGNYRDAIHKGFKKDLTINQFSKNLTDRIFTFSNSKRGRAAEVQIQNVADPPSAYDTEIGDNIEGGCGPTGTSV
ncbi:hypothetical protein L2E82_28208 [Cichorium intybus]|uniref:Uncharacterized protein n=1 Tax=Cichorium intybus TaxID=13427 RepID=A0ACB9CV57_CICIN|nr:hypothetical protein L2E82_28208 [Cichorium intybus]